jgi:HPr kinase/phosphorylase
MTMREEEESKEYGGEKPSVTISSFLDAGRDGLQMELIAGKGGLDRKITEAAINRPGLALSGFFKHFAHRRIQVIGLAEYAFLSSLSDEERSKRVQEFFASKIPCVVVARGKQMFAEVVAQAEEYKVPVLRTKMITKHFVNAATIVMENMMAPRMTIQGTMIEIMGIGVLIEGKHGMGKSEAALGLIEKGHALVSDDVTVLRRDSANNIIASPASAIRYHMEIRGIGIIHVPSLFGVASVREEKKLDLVASLCSVGTLEEEDRSGMTNRSVELLGVKIPRVFIPVAPGRALANIIQTAALDEKLRRLGHDAAKELDERLMSLMSGSKAGSE